MHTHHNEVIDVNVPSLLIVDDDPLVRDVMRRMVGASFPQLEIREAPDGDQALELLDDSVVCVLSDVRMPKRDGIQLCWSVRNSGACRPFCDVPVILVTAAMTGTDLAERAWKAGTAMLLRKPFGPEDLTELITAATGLTPREPKSEQESSAESEAEATAPQSAEASVVTFRKPEKLARSLADPAKVRWPRAEEA